MNEELRQMQSAEMLTLHNENYFLKQSSLKNTKKLEEQKTRLNSKQDIIKSLYSK